MTDSYHSDHRVRSRDKWYTEFMEDAMSAFITIGEEDILVPCKYEVCPTCNGTGKHVNPSIDCEGLTAEDFARDPDFAQDYASGHYDMTCYGCGGKRVVPVMDREKIDPKLLEQIDHHLEEQESYRRIHLSEITRGA